MSHIGQCLTKCVLNKHLMLLRLSLNTTYTAAAKSSQSCPTLCDPIDGRPPGSTVPGILKARAMYTSLSLNTKYTTRESASTNSPFQAC